VKVTALAASATPPPGRRLGAIATGREFAVAEDLRSALDAIGDTEALAQELRRAWDRGGLVGSS
jgi:hypothetical protein